MRTLSTTLLALLAMSGTANTCECEGEHGERHEQLVERFDTNGDGTLDEAERATAKAAMEAHRGEIAAKILKEHPELDTNGDGKLSKEEAEAGRTQRRDHRGEKMQEKHPELFARLDTDGDGKLSKEEFAAGRKDKDCRPQHPGRPPRGGDTGGEAPEGGEHEGHDHPEGEGHPHGHR